MFSSFVSVFGNQILVNRMLVRHLTLKYSDTSANE